MSRKRSFSVFYMFAVTLFFSALVTGIYQINQKRIEINEQVRLQKVILYVLGIDVPDGASNAQVQDIYDRRVEKKTMEEKVLYVGFDQGGQGVSGYAFPLRGPGFWGPIYGMMGVNPQLEKVLGIAFYEHSETPGLGGRITEKWFENQFKGKPLKASGEKPRYFDFRPPGTADEPTEVDAISGATETSWRVEKFMNEDLSRYLSWIEKQKEQGTIPVALEAGDNADRRLEA
jgi:Na+-transporting NADH:ubiquinone oxidoreductase subunit C